jgi:hypothetical protein
MPSARARPSRSSSRPPLTRSTGNREIIGTADPDSSLVTGGGSGTTERVGSLTATVALGNEFS